MGVDVTASSLQQDAGVTKLDIKSEYLNIFIKHRIYDQINEWSEDNLEDIFTSHDHQNSQRRH